MGGNVLANQASSSQNAGYRLIKSRAVRLSPISSLYGAKYLVTGSSHVVFHSIFLPPYIAGLLLLVTSGGGLEL